MAFLTSSDKALWHLALPMIFSNITVPLLGLVDTAVIGHLYSPGFFGGGAGGGTATRLFFFFFVFFRPFGILLGRSQPLKYFRARVPRARFLVKNSPK